MLVRESQGFDLQEIWLAQQTIDVDTQRMSGQLAVQTGTQAPKGMGVVLLNGKLPRQLAIDRFDQLTDGIMQMLERFRDLLFLVRARDRSQKNAVLSPTVQPLWLH